MILFRPTGYKELLLIKESGWSDWPPRLPDQPIFYPVITQLYAEKIARDWNSVLAAQDNYGFVTKFEIDEDTAARYPVEQAGGKAHEELWVPAEDLIAFNRGIVGQITPVKAFKDKAAYPLDQALVEIGAT
jgi:hypothetical protein